MLWLLGCGIETSTRVLDGDEPGLRALIERRASIAERLALELDDEAFAAPELDAFNPEATEDDARTTYLSPMEALLLYIAVAPSQAETPWLTYAEADAIFGDQARRADERWATERRRVAATATIAGAMAATTLSASRCAGRASTPPSASAGRSRSAWPLPRQRLATPKRQSRTRHAPQPYPSQLRPARCAPPRTRSTRR